MKVSLEALKLGRVFDSGSLTREEVQWDVIDYIGIYFSKWRHSYLGHLCPNDFNKEMELKNAA